MTAPPPKPAPTTAATASQEAIPGRILFACTHNMVRSPMAEMLARAALGQGVRITSCGIHPGIIDGFTVRVMGEIGLDLSRHMPRDFTALAGEAFDLVVAFSDESREAAAKHIAQYGGVGEYWPVHDAALTSENQQARLLAYRGVRDTIAGMITAKWGGKPQDSQNT